MFHPPLRASSMRETPTLISIYIPPLASASRHPDRTTTRASLRNPQGSTTMPSLYTAKFPLVGFEAIDGLPYPLADPAALHVALLIDCSENGIWLFDFLPEDPTNPFVTSRLIAGQGVRAHARSRQLSDLPRRRQSVGESRHRDAIDRAIALQQQWDGTELKLFHRDCRHFVDALLAELRQESMPP